jgi:hypothetical protein
VHEGYFRQLSNGMIVFQLRGLREEVYMSLQGTDRYTPGLTLRITLPAFKQSSLKQAFNARGSTVVWSIAGNTAQQLVFAVELVAVDETTGKCELRLTATAEDYMLLATAIRERQDKRVKQGTATFTIAFGSAGVLLFSVPFKWRSLATCKKMSEGVYPLTL